MFLTRIVPRLPLGCASRPAARPAARRRHDYTLPARDCRHGMAERPCQSPSGYEVFVRVGVNIVGVGTGNRPGVRFS